MKIVVDKVPEKCEHECLFCRFDYTINKTYCWLLTEPIFNIDAINNRTISIKPKCPLISIHDLNKSNGSISENLEVNKLLPNNDGININI